MSMRTLWRNRGVLLRWSAFILILTATATVLYLMLPPEPRWQHAAERLTVLDAGNGRIALFQPGQEAATGPVRLLDATTGAEIGRFLSETDTFTDSAQSADGRYFVALLKGSRPQTCRICGIDFHEQRAWQVDWTGLPISSAVFSPRCDFVALQLPQPKGENAHAIVDTASGRVVARVEFAGQLTRIAFADDGGCAVVAYNDSKASGHIHAVHTRTGKTVQFKDARFVGIAPDSRCLIADRGGDGVWVGDLATGSWRCSLEGADHRWAEGDTRGVAIVDFDSDVIVYRRRSRRIWAFAEVSNMGGDIVLRQGRRPLGGIWNINNLPGVNPLFTPDGRRALWRGRAWWAGHSAAVYDLQTGKHLFGRTSSLGQDELLFTPDSRHVVAGVSDKSQIEILDAATGATDQTIALPSLVELEARLTRDGRTLLVAASPMDHEPHWLLAKILEWLPKRPETEETMLRAYDLETGTALGELWTDDPDAFWLSDDRRSLITVHHQYNDENRIVGTTIRCWDLPPAKPLRWVAGCGVALAMLMLGLRFAWRRLRRRPASSAA